jgi:addiction module HigA family antidote
MPKPKKVFAVHAGEILKIEFMEPMGVTAYALAKGLNFRGIYEVVRGERAISADTAIRLGRFFGLQAQFGSIFKMITISGLPKAAEGAEASGYTRLITPPGSAHDIG